MPDQLTHSGVHPGETVEGRQTMLELGPSVRRYLDEEIFPSLERRWVEPSALGDGPVDRSADGPSTFERVQEIYLQAAVAEFRKDGRALGHAVAEAHLVVRRLDAPQEDGLPFPLTWDNGAPLETAEAFFTVSALVDCGRVAGDTDLIEGAVALFLKVWESGRSGQYGGFRKAPGPCSDSGNEFCGPAAYLDAMEACNSLLTAIGTPEWPKRWLELALLLIAGFYDPATGLLGEEFLLAGASGEHLAGNPVDGRDNFRAAWVLLRTAAVLEEPGFADMGRRLLDSMLREVKVSDLAGSDGWDSLNHRDLADALAALVGYYRLRPSKALLVQAEKVWSAITRNNQTLSQCEQAEDGSVGTVDIEGICRQIRAWQYAAGKSEG